MNRFANAFPFRRRELDWQSVRADPVSRAPGTCATNQSPPSPRTLDLPDKRILEGCKISSDERQRRHPVHSAASDSTHRTTIIAREYQRWLRTTDQRLRRFFFSFFFFLTVYEDHGGALLSPFVATIILQIVFHGWISRSYDLELEREKRSLKERCVANSRCANAFRSTLGDA